MYLSRLLLNPRHRAARADLGDCQSLHRTIMAAFPSARDTAARQQLGVLYRVETRPHTGEISLLVQSHEAPDWGHLPTGYLIGLDAGQKNQECKRVDEQYAAVGTGLRLRFRLRANPTRKIDTKSGPDGRRRHGRRVELREESAQVAWLRRKGEQHGFALGPVHAGPAAWNGRVMPGDKVTGARGEGSSAGRDQRMTFAAATFDGELVVTDAALFHAALEQGIGSAKAYGFGLLSVGPLGE